MMKQHFKLSLLLTPAIFLLAFWTLALSGGELLVSIGLLYSLLWALLLSFAVAYSITLFAHEILQSQHHE